MEMGSRGACGLLGKNSCVRTGPAFAVSLALPRHL